MTAEARADYTALLWEQQEAAREQAYNPGEYDDYLDRLAEFIPAMEYVRDALEAMS